MYIFNDKGIKKVTTITQNKEIFQYKKNNT
jgi:hypothetical protein